MQAHSAQRLTWINQRAGRGTWPATLPSGSKRTSLAWQRTAIALIGFSFVVERFGLFLRMDYNQPLSPSQRGFSLWLGVGLLLIAAGVSVISAMQFRTFLRGLGEKEIPRGYWTTALADPIWRRTCTPKACCASTRPADLAEGSGHCGHSALIGLIARRR